MVVALILTGFSEQMVKVLNEWPWLRLELIRRRVLLSERNDPWFGIFDFAHGHGPAPNCGGLFLLCHKVQYGVSLTIFGEQLRNYHFQPRLHRRYLLVNRLPRSDRCFSLWTQAQRSRTVLCRGRDRRCHVSGSGFGNISHLYQGLEALVDINYATNGQCLQWSTIAFRDSILRRCDDGIAVLQCLLVVIRIPLCYWVLA